MNSKTHRLRVGKFEVLIIKDGSGGPRPLADLVEEIPADLLARRIFMEGGLMLVDTSDRRILLDAGNGPDRGPRAHTAEAAFEEAGIHRESIDLILLTHGDPDHVAGLLDSRGDPVYPRATIVLSNGLWNALCSDPSAGLYFAGQASHLRKLAAWIEDRSTRIDTEEEVAPGIFGVPAPGHRAGHTAYRFESQGTTLYHIGDAAFDPLFLERTELVIGQEFRPLEARATREALSYRASRENALVVGSHFDATNVGRLRSTGIAGRFAWKREMI